MKKTPRLYNRKLKKEYAKGFEAGCQKHSAEVRKASEDLLSTIKNSLGKYVSEQLIESVSADIPVTLTIEISGKDLLDIMEKRFYLLLLDVK